MTQNRRRYVRKQRGPQTSRNTEDDADVYNFRNFIVPPPMDDVFSLFLYVVDVCTLSSY